MKFKEIIAEVCSIPSKIAGVNDAANWNLELEYFTYVNLETMSGADFSPKNELSVKSKDLKLYEFSFIQDPSIVALVWVFMDKRIIKKMIRHVQTGFRKKWKENEDADGVYGLDIELMPPFYCYDPGMAMDDVMNDLLEPQDLENNEVRGWTDYSISIWGGGDWQAPVDFELFQMDNGKMYYIKHLQNVIVKTAAAGPTKAASSGKKIESEDCTKALANEAKTKGILGQAGKPKEWVRRSKYIGAVNPLDRFNDWQAGEVTMREFSLRGNDDCIGLVWSTKTDILQTKILNISKGFIKLFKSVAEECGNPGSGDWRNNPSNLPFAVVPPYKIDKANSSQDEDYEELDFENWDWYDIDDSGAVMFAGGDWQEPMDFAVWLMDDGQLYYLKHRQSHVAKASQKPKTMGKHLNWLDGIGPDHSFQKKEEAEQQAMEDEEENQNVLKMQKKVAALQAANQNMPNWYREAQEYCCKSAQAYGNLCYLIRYEPAAWSHPIGDPKHSLSSATPEGARFIQEALNRSGSGVDLNKETIRAMIFKNADDGLDSNVISFVFLHDNDAIALCYSMRLNQTGWTSPATESDLNVQYMVARKKLNVQNKNKVHPN